MKRKIFLLFLLILISLLAVLYILNSNKVSNYRAYLKDMSPDNIINEYFNALNKHDKAMVKQIISPDRSMDQFYWNDVKSAKIIEMEDLRDYDKNSDYIAFRVIFEVKFNHSGIHSFLSDGAQTWTFTLIKSKDDNQWHLYDYGY